MCSKILFIFFIYCLSLTSCEDWCEVIAPNKTYKGLGIYRQYKELDSGQYWMYNKQGLQWKVDFTLDASGHSNITMVNSSIRRLTNRVNMFFGLYYEISDNRYYSINCRKIDGLTYCQYLYPGPDGSPTSYNLTHDNQLNSDFVYLKLYPSQTQDNYLIAINKNNRQNRTRVKLEPPDIQYSDCSNICPSIPMVDQMKASLFARIDSIADYNIRQSDKSGHILVFDINGQPFYCIQPENQSLSKEVY